MNIEQTEEKLERNRKLVLNEVERRIRQNIRVVGSQGVHLCVGLSGIYFTELNVCEIMFYIFHRRNIY